MVLERDGPAYPPDRDCIYVDTYDSTKCDAQWDEWEGFCLDNWTPMCERVYAEFYWQDADWVWPDRPDEECAVAPMDERMTDDCVNQWDTLWKQCFWETDEDPMVMYMWSEDCDMVTAFASAWNQWYGTEDWALNLKRAIKKMEPKHALAKKAAKAFKAKKAASAPVHSRKLRNYRSKPAAKVMQDWAVVSAMPSEECLNFYTMVENEEKCDAEWAYWGMVCDDNWDTEPACEGALTAWFDNAAHEGNWQTVTSPDAECWVEKED